MLVFPIGVAIEGTETGQISACRGKETAGPRKEPPTRPARFGVVLVWSLTANIDKIGVQNSSPIIWTITAHLSVAVFTLPIVFLKSKPNIQNLKSNFRNLILIGFINTLAILCQMSALQLALVSFVIAVKRTSALFNVLWGWLIFKEQGIKERIAGSIIMIIGVIVITLSKMV
ncbi:MAG: DMT family transporter [Cyanobacteria bacterium P01_H01_bin.150]